MNARRTLLTLAIIAALPAFAAEAKAIPVVDHEFELFESGGNITVEVNGQTVQGEEAKRHAEEARQRARKAREEARAAADRVREEVRVRMPDMAGLGEAISSSLAYSFTSGNVKSIKNAPYSGEVINERIQNLADGNQLIKRSTNRVFRDSQGATRQEVVDDNGQVKVVHVRDGEGNRFVITPAKKSALKISPARNLGEMKWSQSGAADGEKRIVVQTDKGNAVVSTSENIVVKRVDKDGKERSEEVRVHVTPSTVNISGLEGLRELGRLGDLSQHGEFAFFGDAFAAAGDAFSMAWRRGEPSFVRGDKSYERTTTQLGSKNFDGVTAEGKMVSYTIPAGKVGNVKPITVTSETWYSPDLQITVYSKQSDPRSGDIIYRVANLKRSEQPSDLFRVPANFTVMDPVAKLGEVVKIEKFDKSDKR